MGTARRERMLGTACAFAFVLLAAAGVLAVWGLAWAARPVMPVAPGGQTVPGGENADFQAVLLTALAVAVAVTVALVVGIRRSRAHAPVEELPEEQVRGSAGLAVLAVVGVAALVAAAWLNHLPGRVQFVRDHFCATQQASAAAGAWLLSVAGTVVAAIVVMSAAKVAVPLWFSRLVAGVLVAAVVGAGVVYSSAGGRGIDATTAEQGPIPAVPEVLGARQFSLTVSQPPSRSQIDPAELVSAAGTGFVVLQDSGVRAYDSSGRERWHYLRSGPPHMAATDMAVYDDGHTVMVEFASAGTSSALVDRLVALDAVTGQTLWETDNFGHRYPLRAPFWMPEGSRYMFTDDGQGRFTRIDTRSGKPMWSLQFDDGTCVRRGADIGAHVVYAAACLTGDEVTLRAVSIDAISGQSLVDKVIDRYRARLGNYPGNPAANLNLSVRAATDNTVAVNDFTAGAPRPQDWRAVSVGSGEVAWIKKPVRFRGDPGPDVLTHTFGDAGPGLAMRTEPSLLDRCTLAATPRDDQAVAWLGRQVVVADGTGLAAFSRDTCAPAGRRSVSAGAYDLVAPAPGVLLGVSRSGSGLVVDGYSADQAGM